MFLGRLADLAGGGERAVEPAPLARVLTAMEPELAEALMGERIRMALNGALVSRDSAIVLADGDELAFLPPVSGG